MDPKTYDKMLAEMHASRQQQQASVSKKKLSKKALKNLNKRIDRQ